MRVHNNLALQRGFEFIVSMKTAPRTDSGFKAVFYRNPLPPNGKCCKIELRLARAYTSCLASGNPQLCIQEVFFL